MVGTAISENPELSFSSTPVSASQRGGIDAAAYPLGRISGAGRSELPGERILTNLLSNALKYSAPGTPCSVRTYSSALLRRYGPTLGFKEFGCASAFCAAVDEVRHLFRTRTVMKETIALAQGRRHFQQSVAVFEQLFLNCPVADAKRRVTNAA